MLRLIVSKKMITFFERAHATVGSDGSMSINLLSSIGMVAVVPTSALGCGFAFTFDMAATTLMLVCGTRSSCGSARTSVLS